MTIRLHPYLNFHGNTREVLTTSRAALGGSLDLMQYDSIPGMMGDDDEGANSMHGQLDTPEIADQYR